MKAQSTGPILSAIFVDYDNVYLSLKRKNEEAARRFAKDAAIWLKEIETGALITATNGSAVPTARRIAMNRCYGNPVPRRNSNDNSTDMNSFPFVRHHFLRAGFEAIDCPPLTSQLKNSADIKMVLDIGDLLSHSTYFDEFVILSGDADFTPVLHRLRAHARRTIVFATDHTAAPYTAISDGEIRESDLIALLMEGRIGAAEPAAKPAVEARGAATSSAQLEAMRKEIVAEVVSSVRAAARPVPLEALADRAVRVLGHEKTVASAWGGAGSFRDLLNKGLPADVRLSDQPPYVVIDMSRQLAQESAPAPERIEARPEIKAPRGAEPVLPPMRDMRLEEQRYDRPAQPPQQAAAPAPSPAPRPPQRAFLQPPQQASAPLPPTPSLPYPPQEPAAARAAAPAAPQPRQPDAAAIQQSIARIHEACQAPPLSPPEYRALFSVIAEEINTNNLAGVQTLINIGQRARDLGLELRRDDIRFVLEVVSEADPWFEQGASAALFASRFRNFVVARCRSQGLNLSADEIDLIDAWFGGAAPRASAGAAEPRAPAAPQAPAPAQPQASRWGFDQPPTRPYGDEGSYGAQTDEEFPRIVRTRLRG